MNISVRTMLTRDAAHTLRLALLGLGVLALLLAVAVRLSAPTTHAHSLIGQAAPAFTLPAEAEGARLPHPVRLPARTGHPLLLVFAYSLCPHCVTEMQSVVDLQTRDAGRGLDVVYLDSPAEGASVTDAYMRRLGVTAPVLLDTGGAVARLYGVQYYPGVVLLDGSGVVRYVATGETSQPALANAITRLLAPA
ncbi:MAG: TlpA family protein disulfide reductase [Ktedonobacterales bacterium]